MKHTKNKNRLNSKADTDLSIENLCKCDLKGKIELMAQTARGYIVKGLDDFLLAAIIAGQEGAFLFGKLIDDQAKFEMQDKIVQLAVEQEADCLVMAATAYAASGSGHVRPSMDPLRKRVIAVMGKDKFEHLGGFQEIPRSRKKANFDKLEVWPMASSWLDDYPNLQLAQRNS
jgi:hypothetical protein